MWGETRQRGQAGPRRARPTVSHETISRPLLPSGPGGVEQRSVAQDLTSLCRSRNEETLATKKSSADKPTNASRLMTIVELRGLEPPTFRMRTERSPIELQPLRQTPDLSGLHRNPPLVLQPSRCKRDALTLSYSPAAHPKSRDEPRQDTRYSNRTELRLNIERNAERVNCSRLG